MNTQIVDHREPLEVHQHAVFRALLQAMSRPGSIQPLPQINLSADPQASSQEHLTNLLDCLFDQEVNYCLAAPDAALSAQIHERWDAQMVAVEQADFLLVPAGNSHGQLERLKRGTPDFPDQGASVVYQVKSFATGGITPHLTGPGIKESAQPSINGLESEELEALRQVNSEFPLGVDVICISLSGELLCIPRSTRIGDE
ncbi:MAG: phosphonate C-P lyase system protein PhnH [Desulfuromonadales bacterium]|nr:phosphonate C-P lyase system protein PhnH [Desulfuromonadales bacterium]